MKTINEYNRFFWEFVNKYDTDEIMIFRKIIHSYEVANHAFKIACHLEFNSEDRLFAYLCGLFHDLGRFEQWKTYQTYNDKESADHGDMGYNILCSYDCKKQFDLSERQIEILKMSVKFHTKPYLGDDKDIALYTKIIKNSDAMANINTTANGSHRMTATLDGVTSEVLNDFVNLKPLWIYPVKTKLDRCLMLTANCYYVRFPFLRKEIWDCKFIDIMCETFSKYLNEQDKISYRQAVEDMKINFKQSCDKTMEQIDAEDGDRF